MPCRKSYESMQRHLSDVQARRDAEETRSDEACEFVLLAKAIRKCDTTLVEAIPSYEEDVGGCFAELTSFSKNIKHSL